VAVGIRGFGQGLTGRTQGTRTTVSDHNGGEKCNGDSETSGETRDMKTVLPKAKKN